jgi:LysR family transcriptional regulator, nod-box dependent transcriptional activator
VQHPISGRLHAWPVSSRLPALKLSQVDLNLLVALDALLRERNVTLAGKRLGLGQSAMSAALARLRDMFQDELLERVGRTYRLTPAADALTEPLQAALEAVQRTLDRNATFDASTSKRRFRIAMSDHLLVCLYPGLVERVRRQAPYVQLHAQPVTPEIGTHLAARKLDLSIQPANLVREARSQAVLEDRWICAVWRDNHLVKKRLTREQLRDLPHASFSVAHTPLAEQVLAPVLGTPPTVHVTTGSFVSLPFLLRGTTLIALMQQTLAERLRAVAELRVLELPIETPPLIFEMSWNPILTGDPAHTWLRDVVSELGAFDPRESPFGSNAANTGQRGRT